jgi:hypothetical protein
MTGKEIKSFLNINSTSFDQIYLVDENNNDFYREQIKDDSEYEFSKLSERVSGAGIGYNYYLIREKTYF